MTDELIRAIKMGRNPAGAVLEHDLQSIRIVSRLRPVMRRGIQCASIFLVLLFATDLRGQVPYVGYAEATAANGVAPDKKSSGWTAGRIAMEAAWAASFAADAHSSYIATRRGPYAYGDYRMVNLESNPLFRDAQGRFSPVRYSLINVPILVAVPVLESRTAPAKRWPVKMLRWGIIGLYGSRAAMNYQKAYRGEPK
jgi:hypothetical protein